MLERSAVGQLSSLSSRTKWQRLSADDLSNIGHPNGLAIGTRPDHVICVLAVRLRRCPTLSNPVLWQSWMAAYLSCTLKMKTMFPGWPIMVHDTHMRRRSAASSDPLLTDCVITKTSVIPIQLPLHQPLYIHKYTNVYNVHTFGNVQPVCKQWTDMNAADTAAEATYLLNDSGCTLLGRSRVKAGHMFYQDLLKL